MTDNNTPVSAVQSDEKRERIAKLCGELLEDLQWRVADRADSSLPEWECEARSLGVKFEHIAASVRGYLRTVDRDAVLREAIEVARQWGHKKHGEAMTAETAAHCIATALVELKGKAAPAPVAVAPVVPSGEVVVTWDEARTRIVAVTRQDEEGRVLSVIAHAAPAARGERSEQPSAAQAAGVEKLHSAIMDLRPTGAIGICADEYKRGHYAARIAAAELVAAHFATTPSEGVAAPVLDEHAN